MGNREDKLKQLSTKQPQVTKVDGSEFITQFDEKIQELKGLFGMPDALGNDAVLAELKGLQGLTPQLEAISAAIKGFHIPDLDIPENVSISGLDELQEAIEAYTEASKAMSEIPSTITLDGLDKIDDVIKALQAVKIPDNVEVVGVDKITDAIKGLKIPDTKVTFTDKKQLKEFQDSIGLAISDMNAQVKAVYEQFAKAIDELAKNVYKGSQDEADFIPTRRVRKIGNKLVFDDDAWAGVVSGGGNNVPTIEVDGQFAVPVVNPDGTPIAGGGGGSGTASAENQELQITEAEETNTKLTDVINQIQDLRGFQIPDYDEIELGYTGANVTLVEYKAATVTVATLTLSYTGDNLTNVVLS